MMSLTFGLFSQVSASGPHGPLVLSVMMDVKFLVSRCHTLNYVFITDKPE